MKSGKKRESHGLSSRSGTAPPLESRWPKGVSGNPAGRPRIGLSIIETINLFASQQKTTVELEKIQNNRREPIVRRIAAARLLGAGERGREGREESSELMDRTNGRPVQSIDLNAQAQQINLTAIVGEITAERANEIYQQMLSGGRIDLDELEALENRAAPDSENRLPCQTGGTLSRMSARTSPIRGGAPPLRPGGASIRKII
jgi:hypothetical protein